MAPSDGMEIIRSQGEAPRLPTAVDGEANVISRFSNHGAFHRYMDLPFDIRQQIRIEAITEVRGDFRQEDPPEKPCFPLALVSKEWAEDVEEALFSEIQINTLDEQEVSKFKELFSTDRRKSLLTRLDIAIDDTHETGPWYQPGGIVQISHLMETIGQFLHYINGWRIFRKSGSQQIEIVVVTSYWEHRFHNPIDKELYLIASSLWEWDDLELVTDRGWIPDDLPLKAISSEFPSSLNMVKHLGFPPNFLPLPAAQKIIQIMPNLETCLLESRLFADSGRAWKGLIGIIHQLRASAPSLRSLMLCNPFYTGGMVKVSPSSIEFAVLLRDYSQGLESLRANPFELDREFFLPFSPRIGKVKSRDRTWNDHFAWRWLKDLDLQFHDGESIGDSKSTDDDEQESDASSDSDTEARRKSWFKPGTTWFPTNKLGAEPRVPRNELKLSPADILIAAGRAAWFMPVLRSAHISVRSEHGIFVKRELPYGPGGAPVCRVFLKGCSAFEEQEILRAWQPSLGSGPKPDPELESEFFEARVPDPDSDDSESDDPGSDGTGSCVSGSDDNDQH